MGQVIIRNLDDSVLADLKRLATNEGKSLEQYLRDLLAERARQDKRSFFEFAQGMRDRSQTAWRDATDLIREDRDR